MAKLSRNQLKQIRRQARESRARAEEEKIASNGEILEPEDQKLERKDKLGLTQSQRKKISEIKENLEQVKQKITWSFTPGDLVHLPTGEIGMIVENNAVDLEIQNTSYDAKKTLTNNRYSGKVFVVTSSGNNWYYPKQLKVIKL